MKNVPCPHCKSIGLLPMAESTDFKCEKCCCVWAVRELDREPTSELDLATEIQKLRNQVKELSGLVLFVINQRSNLN